MKFLLMLLVATAFAYAQEGIHRWKPLVINDKEKIWYDQSMLDSLKGDKLNIWILQMYKQPLTYEGIVGEVYRSKIQYAINLKNVKYGILNAIYYDISNKEMYNFNYNINNYPDDLKYTYPITENSFLFTLLKEIYANKGTQTN
ncbi:MAG: hypothetical protein P4L27_12750 [Ignavibacteriaceae bacterium]|nr:hypothetical protein [Ignavibacteriaceae bacterium]